MVRIVALQAIFRDRAQTSVAGTNTICSGSNIDSRSVWEVFRATRNYDAAALNKQRALSDLLPGGELRGWFFVQDIDRDRNKCISGCANTYNTWGDSKHSGNRLIIVPRVGKVSTGRFVL